MTDIITAIMWIAGALFALLAAIGVLRMPDVFTRMQASTKAATLGLGCLLVGARAAIGRLRIGHPPVEHRRVHPAHHPGVGAGHRARGVPGRGAALERHRARRAERQCGSPARERASDRQLKGRSAARLHSGMAVSATLKACLQTKCSPPPAARSIGWNEWPATGASSIRCPIHERQRLHRVIAALSTADPAANRRRRKVARADRRAAARKRS